MAKANTPPAAPPAVQDEPQMVRVELTTGLAGDRFSYAPGQLLDVDQETATRWIERGIARDPRERTREVHTYRELRTDAAPPLASVPPDDGEKDAGDDDDESGELDE